MKPARLFRAITSPSFLRDLLRFRAQSRAIGRDVPSLKFLRPIAGEATAQTGFDTHYVYHTAWAARVLARTRPEKHIDIGSSLFFVGNVSAFIPMVHYDYRPPALHLEGAEMASGDLLALPMETGSIASLSCMHVIEHVGLGRYGDTLDAAGDIRACAELARVLCPGGRLLFATPVGKPSVHFNAHRIYSYEGVLALFPDLELEEFALITDKRDGATLIPNADPARVSNQRYGCGCFVFRKRGA